MFAAQLLQLGTTVYSPWFEREGDYFRPTVDLVAIGPTGDDGTLEVEVWTKKKEDTGDGADANTGVSIVVGGTGGVGRGTAEWGPSALKELVRYRFICTVDWVLFRMLTPVWFNAVKA